MNGELVSSNVSNKDLYEEVNRRTAKAGYTTRYGECTGATKIQVSVSFGESKLNIWPRDSKGNLIE